MLQSFLHSVITITLNTSHIRQHYHPGSFISFAMKNPRRFFCLYFLPCIKFWQARGDVSNVKPWDFFILLNVHGMYNKIKEQWATQLLTLVTLFCLQTREQSLMQKFKICSQEWMWEWVVKSYKENKTVTSTQSIQIQHTSKFNMYP